MSAHAAVEHLSALIDGELEERERRRVDLHLAACPGCRARLEGSPGSGLAFGTLPDHPAIAQLIERVQPLPGSPAPDVG